MYWRNKNYANGQPAALYMLYEVYEGRVQLVETCCMQQRFNYIHSIYISSWQHCNILAWSHSLKNLRNLLFNVICVTAKLLTTAAPVSSPIYIDQAQLRRTTDSCAVIGWAVSGSLRRQYCSVLLTQAHNCITSLLSS